MGVETEGQGSMAVHFWTSSLIKPLLFLDKKLFLFIIVVVTYYLPAYKDKDAYSLFM